LIEGRVEGCKDYETKGEVLVGYKLTTRGKLLPWTICTFKTTEVTWVLSGSNGNLEGIASIYSR
jgi:hypothetical protein